MAESINLRICSCYWIKQDDSGYDFKGYEAELRTSDKKEWGKEMLHDGRFSTPASASGSLQDIVHRIFSSGENYRKMAHPSYNFLLWEGNWPLNRHEREKSRLLTRLPKREVKDRLIQLFDEYYLLRGELINGNYEKAYLHLMKSRNLRDNVLNSLTNKEFIDFYISLRKKSLRKGIQIVKNCGVQIISGDNEKGDRFFSKEREALFYELETEYLHSLEGKRKRKKTLLFRR